MGEKSALTPEGRNELRPYGIDPVGAQFFAPVCEGYLRKGE
jgi:hypothetical protein